MFRLIGHLRNIAQCGLHDLLSRQTKPKTPTALSINTLPFFTPQALYRLKKIVQWSPNRPLVRRASAISMWARVKPQAEIARLLQAAISKIASLVEQLTIYKDKSLCSDTKILG